LDAKVLLTARNGSAEFDNLSDADCQAIREILIDQVRFAGVLENQEIGICFEFVSESMGLGPLDVSAIRTAATAGVKKSQCRWCK
jgi:hypothetical protein